MAPLALAAPGDRWTMLLQRGASHSPHDALGRLRKPRACAATHRLLRGPDAMTCRVSHLNDAPHSAKRF
ncbi:hypothetical protein VARIO8X_90257 [Burkholderiales bacterium 8X]|nr:hypothetical protein VARIO8X_90257 [Burkholderiales bacterium 8X]